MNRHASAALLAIVAAIAGPPASVRAAAARIDLAVSIPASSRNEALQEDLVLRGIAEAAVQAWPALLEIRPGETGDASARVTVTRDARAITVATELRPASGPMRGLRSTVPPGSDAAVAPTAAADIAWLWAAAAGFAGLAPGPAPGLSAVLETDSLASLTGWSPTGLEPISIASSPEGLTILFPRGWVTLAPFFRIVKETARDLLLQPSRDGPVFTSLARSARGSIVLARADGAVQLVDPLLAVRGEVAAPSGARLLATGGHEAVFISGSEAACVPLDSGETESQIVRIAAAWTTAVDSDAAGNLWAWDNQERRLRVTNREGREIAAIRPLVRAADLPVPQALAVLADGSFLLGGSGELWRFASSGIPSWRLSRLPGVPGESLPASFVLAVDRPSGAIWLLDGPSRRVLQFGGIGRTLGEEPAAGSARALAALLQELDERDTGRLEQAGTLALAADMPLVAARFATRLARAGAADAGDLAAAAEVMVLRDLARAAAGSAAELAAGLLAERALAACQQAVDLARAWRDRDPADPEAGRLLEELTGRRRELRDAATAKDDAPAIAAVARTGGSGDRRTVVARLVLRAPATADLAGLRVSFSFPGWTPVPATAEVGALAAGAQRVVELELALGDVPQRLPAALTAAAWMRWERGTEGRSAGLRLDVAVEDAGREGAPR